MSWTKRQSSVNTVTALRPEDRSRPHAHGLEDARLRRKEVRRTDGEADLAALGGSRWEKPRTLEKQVRATMLRRLTSIKIFDATAGRRFQYLRFEFVKVPVRDKISIPRKVGIEPITVVIG